MLLSTTEAPAFARAMRRLTGYLSEDFLGGAKIVKLAWVINLQKGGTAFFVGGLMAYFENTSPAAWVYLALHGTYGLCWLLKDLTFPDPAWQKRVTFGGALMAFLLVLGPYWVAPFLLVSGALGTAPTRSMPLLAACIAIHTLGLALMIGADAQKYYVLKHKRGLIEDGFFRFVRHPNYLGEMMIYGSYALLVGHWLPWVILAWVWGTLFLTNMLMKEASMSRHPGWQAYKARTGMLLPWPFGAPATAAPARPADPDPAQSNNIASP